MKRLPLSFLSSVCFLAQGVAQETHEVDHPAFIESLETAPDFLVIEEIVLSQREALDDSSLVLTLGVSTYYRSGDGV